MYSQYLTLAEAARLVPTRPHAASLHRWARHGLKARNGRRVRLRHVRVGGKLFVRAEWLDEFFEQLANADRDHFEAVDEAQEQAPPMTPTFRGRSASAREREVAEAEAELDRAGI